MTPSNRLTLDTLPDAFEQARGVAADKEWAELVIGRLYLEDINRTLVLEELSGALELVRNSGEGPEELFGEAFDYVEQQTEQWHDDGAPLAPVEPGTSWWDVPPVAACMASFIAVLVLVMEAVSGSWTTSYTLGKVLLPALTGITAIVSITTLETLLMRTRRLWAIAGALVVAVIGGSILLASFLLGNDRPLFTGPLWWYAVLVAGHALITAAIFHWTPHGDDLRARHRSQTAITAENGAASPATEDASDDEWADRLAGILRLRLEMPESEVRSTIAEAHQHALSSGTTMAEEFGSPGAYAARLPRSTAGRRVRERWRRTAWMLAVPTFGYLAFEGLQHGWEWGNIAWFMAIAFAVSCITVIGFLRNPMPPK